MSNILDSEDRSSGLINYTVSGEPHQSVGFVSTRQYDFLDFLGVAQSLKIDFLPITWQPALDRIGQGGTAKIRQALVNLQTTFAFKHLDRPKSATEEARNLHALIAEISILGHPTIRSHSHIASIEGICWDVVSGGEKVWPVLVFEKTEYGDLSRFMRSNAGMQLGLRERLDILFDTALAIRDLHNIGGS